MNINDCSDIKQIVFLRSILFSQMTILVIIITDYDVINTTHAIFKFMLANTKYTFKPRSRKIQTRKQCKKAHFLHGQKG